LGLARSATVTAESAAQFLENIKESLLLADAATENLRERVANSGDSTSSLTRQLTALERTVSGVYSNVQSSTALPTQDQEDAARWVTGRLEELYQQLRTLVNEELPALSRETMSAGGPAFSGSALVLPRADLPRFPERLLDSVRRM
jgi:hypothetical protein